MHDRPKTVVGSDADMKRPKELTAPFVRKPPKTSALDRVCAGIYLDTSIAALLQPSRAEQSVSQGNDRKTEASGPQEGISHLILQRCVSPHIVWKRERLKINSARSFPILPPA